MAMAGRTGPRWPIERLIPYANNPQLHTAADIARGIAAPPDGERHRVASGKVTEGKVLNDDRADWRQAYARFTGDVAYVWHGALHGDVVGSTAMSAIGSTKRQTAHARGASPWGARSGP